MVASATEIIKKARRCIKDGKNLHSAYCALGIASFEKGEHEKALQYYGKSIAVKPEYAPAYAGIGIIYGKKGEVNDSIEYFIEAIKREPDCALLYNWLADAYFDQGKISDAIREYSRATELNSLDSNAHNDLADAYRLQGNFERALDYYQKTIAIDPGDTNAVLELAQVLIQLKRRAEAKKKLLEMVEKFPESEDSKTAKVILGTLFSQDGDFISARDYLAQAARSYPFNPSIQYQLGLCHLILEENSKALNHLEKALDLDPNNSRVVRLIEQARKRIS